ncbi:hypothetical protein YB2330_006233 [Saitoella coloradoensis]
MPALAGHSAVIADEGLHARRMALAGPSGLRGLIHNRRVFAIAIFASFGGLLYGYNQGVFSGVLTMPSFGAKMGSYVTDSGKKGWLTAILELGAYFGALFNGYISDQIGRKRSIIGATIIFCIGVIVQAAAQGPQAVMGGRFITGLGVGSLSMAVPMYNAELAPPEVRGSLVALQQLSICFGILVSFWIDYGTNYIGGTGSTQSEASWRVPLALQLAPALVLGVGMIFMPFSPRWLMNQGREEEALQVLCRVRGLPPTHELIRIEFLEVKAQSMFEKETQREMFPNLQGGGWISNLKLEMHGYLSLITTRSLFRRVAVACLIMFFQQWTGINAVLYYAPTIFQNLGLSGNTISLLATGVVGIAMFLATIPAVIWIDSLGRKPVLVIGALGMASCHLIIAILSGLYEDNWPAHTGAGWGAVVMVWLFVIHFGYSWGPCAWIVVAEVFPLGVRSKGISLGASSNWMNNFIVGQVTPTMLTHMRFGTYIFFGSLTFLGAMYVLFLVPETKSLTLEEMDLLFQDKSGISSQDRERQDRINREIGLDAAMKGLGSGEMEMPGYASEKGNALHQENISPSHSNV